MKKIFYSQRIIWVLLLFFAVSIIYINSFGVPLIYDDLFQIRDVSSKSFGKLIGYGSGLRPLYKLSLLICWQISGGSAWSYHIINLLFHLTAVVVLYLIIERVLLLDRFRKKFTGIAKILAFGIALIWGVHPLLTQAVTYISQRCEVMMGLFYLLSIFFLINADQSSKNDQKWQFSAAAAFACGLFCKETIIIAPFALLFFDRIFLSKSIKGMLKKHSIFYLTTAFIFIIPMIFLLIRGEFLHYLAYFGGRFGISPWHYLITQPEVILQYIRLSFFPDALCFDYAWPVKTSLSSVWFPSIIILTLLGLTVWALFKYPALGFLGIWFFFNLAPRSSIVPLPEPAVEYRMYLPLISLVVIFVLSVYEISVFTVNKYLRNSQKTDSSIKKIYLVIITVTALILGFLTLHRNTIYSNPMKLWEDTIKKAPNNLRAMNYLGIELCKKKDFQLAEKYFREILGKKPDNALAWNNLGNICFEHREYNKAEEFYLKCLECLGKPHNDLVIDYCYQTAYRNLAIISKVSGDMNSAINYYEKSLSFSPEDPYLNYETGSVFFGLGDLQKAKYYFIKSAKYKKDFPPPLIDLGVIALQQGRIPDAENYFKKAIRADANNFTAHFNLGLLYSRSGRHKEAVVEFYTCSQISPNNKEVLKLLKENQKK